MTVLVALAVGALTFGFALVLLTTRRRVRLSRRLDHFASDGAADRGRRTLEGTKLAGAMEWTLVRFGQQRRAHDVLERAAVDSSPGACAGVVVLATLGVATLALVVVGAAGAAVALAIVPAFSVAAVVVRARRRVHAFEGQLPEILDTLAASLRAGHSFHHALQNVSEDVGEPARREFRRVIAEVQLGRTLEASLADLGVLIRSEDFGFVLDAVTIQRQVGGSMAELFEMVAQTVRGRIQFRQNLRAATGMPRASARVLTALPVAAALLLTLVNRSYMSPLFETRSGIVLLSITVLLMLVGGTILKRIGSVRP